jgi:hypothetical protein
LYLVTTAFMLAKLLSFFSRSNRFRDQSGMQARSRNWESKWEANVWIFFLTNHMSRTQGGLMMRTPHLESSAAHGLFIA